MEKVKPIEEDGFYKMVGARIKHLRQSKGLSQEALALTLGLKDRAVIARWESGTRHIPLHSLVDISNALGEDIGYLLGRRKIDRIEDYRLDKRRRSDEPVLQDPHSPYVLYCMTLEQISKAFPGVKASDPRNLLLDRFLYFLQNESAFAHIFTSAEIQEAIEDHFGVVVDLHDLSVLAEVYEGTARKEMNSRANALISLIEREIAKIYRKQRFPDHVASEISSHVANLKEYLYMQGYEIGQVDAESEKEELNDLLAHECMDDFDADLYSEFDQGVKDGYSAEMKDINGPQDWDDI